MQQGCTAELSGGKEVMWENRGIEFCGYCDKVGI